MRTCALSIALTFLAAISLSEALFEGDPCVRVDGLNGHCASNCPGACSSVHAEDVCGYRGLRDAVVCCLTRDDTAKRRRPEPNSYPTLEGICTYYHRNSTGLCYSNPQEQLSGDNVEKEYDPTSHVTAIGWSSLNGIKWGCGGTLISERHVLTAAHCLANQLRTPDTVRIGFPQLSDYPERDDYYVHRVLYHPQYDPRNIYNDLAVLEVYKKDQSSAVQHLPACIWPHADLKTRYVESHLYDTEGSLKITAQNWQILDHYKCRPQYSKPSALVWKGLSEDQVCADRTDEPLGIRQCDDFPSHGLISNNVNIPFVLGVSAYRKQCTTPTIYTMLHSHADWLEEVLKAE